MPDPVQTNRAVVTVNSFPEPSRIEEVPAQSQGQADVDPVERALLINRYRALRQRLAAETASAGTDVLVATGDQEIALFQSRLLELGLEAEPLGPGG